MLLGQQLGRRHQRHLLAVRDGAQRRQRRHQRFAGADVALHQPHHREVFLHIGFDKSATTRLRAGRRERQLGEKTVFQPIVRQQRLRLIALGAGAHRQHAEVMRQQFFEDQAFLRRVFAQLQIRQLDVRWRAVQGVQRPRQASSDRRSARRQQLGDGAGIQQLQR